MKYWLKQMVLEKTPEVEIGLAHFEALRTARKTLVDAFALEEKWDIVVSNYQELENELLLCATEHAVRRVQSYEDLFMLNAPLTVRIVNLLTATRLYLDQAPQHLASETGESLRKAFQEERRKQYDASFEYRFMEALRNHVQHRGIPVHLVTHGGSWLEQPDGERRMEFTTVMKARKNYLQEDSEFKASVLKEMPDEVDLMACSRCYVESLSHLHGVLRERLGPIVRGARGLIEQAIREYSEQPGANTIGLQAIGRDDEGAIVERLPLLLDWDNVRLALERRNPVLVNLSRSYVASRTLK